MPTTTSAQIPAYMLYSSLRIKLAKPVNGFVDVRLNVIASDRIGESQARSQADLVDLGNGYHLEYGMMEFMTLGPSLETFESLAVAAITAGKIYRPAGSVPADAEREEDIFHASVS